MSAGELSEDQIHKAVIAELRIRAKADVVFWHTPNDGKRNPGSYQRLKAMGMIPGIPDLIFCRNSEVFFLEIKAAHGKLSPAQRDFHARMAATGFQVMVERSVDGCMSFLAHSDLLR